MKRWPKSQLFDHDSTVLEFTVVLHRGTSIRTNGYTWDKSYTVPQSSYGNQTIKTILTDLFPQTITHCTTKSAWMFQNTTYKKLPLMKYSDTEFLVFRLFRSTQIDNMISASWSTMRLTSQQMCWPVIGPLPLVRLDYHLALEYHHTTYCFILISFNSVIHTNTIGVWTSLDRFISERVWVDRTFIV